VAIAPIIAFGLVGGAGSTQRSTKDRNLSGTIASSKRMADGFRALHQGVTVQNSGP
jgi:hypothetical protein